MTLSANQRRDRYVATGGQTVFPYTFRVFAAGDLVVERLRAGVTTTLALTTDYTVSGVGADAGGNVTLTAGALAGDIIAIVSDQPNQRTTDFSESGDFRAAAVNAELDRLWIGIQQLAQELARQITAPVSDPPSSYVLPPRSARPNRLLGFDSNGDVVLSTGATLGGVNVSSFSATLLDLSSAATWRGGIGAASPADVAAEAAARSAAIAAETAARSAAIAAEASARTAAIAALPLQASEEIAEFIPTAGAEVVLTHSLGAAPRLIVLRARCVTAEGGFAVNQTFFLNALWTESGGVARGIMASFVNTTEVRLRVSTAGFASAINPTSGVAVALTAANWRVSGEMFR